MLPLLVVILPIILFLTGSGLHKVEEGHVGIYFRGGALIDGVTGPGYHLKAPLVTSMHNIQTSV